MAVVHETSEGSTPTIPGYQVRELLGVGGMGRVYLARQIALNRSVCVKVLSIPEGEDDRLCQARFTREAELLAGVAHPHIVPLFDFGSTGDRELPYLVTEYIEGGDLRKRMAAGKPTPLGRAREIIVQVSDAIEYLHGKGIIHRDLKPENILLSTETSCKVCDFGLAVMRDNSGSLTWPGRGLGTLGYVSPEQHYGLKVDERTDQYSLAALAYELLTGRRPLGRFQPPSTLNPRLSRQVDHVILKGLAEQPSDRYPSVKEFVAALLPSLGTGRRAGAISKRVLIGSLLVLALALTAGVVAVVATGGAGGDHAAPVQEEAHAQPAELEVLQPAEESAQEASNGSSAEQRSPEFTQLTRLRAYNLWVGQGKPEGAAGDAVELKNWIEAEKQIEKEVDARAYSLWEQQGRPTGAAGETASVLNRRTAEKQLLRETEDAMRREADEQELPPISHD